MAEFTFNKQYYDLEKKRVVKADEPVEMTIKRADEVVEKVRKQAKEVKRFAEYKDFAYERLDAPEDKAKDDKSKEADK